MVCMKGKVLHGSFLPETDEFVQTKRCKSLTVGELNLGTHSLFFAAQELKFSTKVIQDINK